MKLLSVIIKGLKEQVRNHWALILSLAMGPFFIFVYFLIIETFKPQYYILIVNNDKGIVSDGQIVNHGEYLISAFRSLDTDTSSIPFTIGIGSGRDRGIESIKKRNADALVIISDSFSLALEKRKVNDSIPVPKIEFIGDLTNTNYLISSVWAKEIINNYSLRATNTERIVKTKETALGKSASIGSFDMIVPGILLVSLIMLMFSASTSFVAEVENKTIMRLKLSKLSTLEFLGGISFVQLIISIISVLLTLITAILLGFQYKGSLLIMISVASLTSLSLTAFSLIIAAITNSAREVLVVGNFPMFLFMFFTGAAFPLKTEALFTIADYPVNIQSLMTPTHAISALNKTLVMNMDLKSIVPEISSIIILTIIYFVIGAVIFRSRHLKLA